MFVVIVTLFFVYVFIPKKLYLTIINSSGSDVSYVTVYVCKKTFSFTKIKNNETVNVQFSPDCEGSYDVSYLNGKLLLISSKNIGYITTHIYAKDRIILFNDSANYKIDRRIL